MVVGPQAAVNRLIYNFKSPADDEPDDCEKTYWLKCCLDRNINETMNVTFNIPPDYVAFTDLNSTYLSVTLQVFRSDGGLLDDSDHVFLGPGALQAIFKSLQIGINNFPLEPTTHYSWSATLTSYLGLSKVSREDQWAELAGMTLPGFPSSKIQPSDVGYFVEKIQKLAYSREVTLTGRLQSDFTQSLSQLLPPGMTLEFSLTRQPDAFTLCSCTDDTLKRSYKLLLNTASIYIKRVKMSPAVLDRVKSSLNNGGKLRYTRLGCIATQIPPTTLSHRWSNIFNSGQLPHTLYLALVSQRAFSGDLNKLPNYFESGWLKSLRVMESGRPILPQPLNTNFKYLNDGYSVDVSKSDASEGYLTLCQALNSIADPMVTAGVSYLDYLKGCLIYCVTLNSCGGRRVPQGFIDIELDFEENSQREPMHLLCFAEYDRILHFDSNNNFITG